MITNNPNLKGQEAGESQFFDCCRFRLYPVHTRFQSIAWFVDDANLEDPVIGGPATIVQADTEQEAIEALLNLHEIKGVKVG